MADYAISAVAGRAPVFMLSAHVASRPGYRVFSLAAAMNEPRVTTVAGRDGHPG